MEPKGLTRYLVSRAVPPLKKQLSREFRARMTRQEALLWDRLRNKGLDGLPFRRQQVIQGFIVDFYCHNSMLVVEVDGPVHDSTEAYDRERDEALARLGLKMFRIRNEDVDADLEGVLSRIAAEAASRAG